MTNLLSQTCWCEEGCHFYVELLILAMGTHSLKVCAPSIVRQLGGFDFLGYHFERNMKWPRKKSLKKFKETIRATTQRRNGLSLQKIISNVNRTTEGWFEYFKHSHYTTFLPLDQWIRMRLRSILRRRSGGRGRGRGQDHHRWPNAFFNEQGLFSFVAAHAKARQSCCR